jgi:serine/threonine-protein kinase RsbW
MGQLKNGKLTVVYASDVKYLHEVEALTSKISEESGFSESDVDDLSIAITELFNNAVHHGNQKERSKKITIHYFLKNKTLTIQIRDEGPGFELQEVRNPLAPENIMADNGRGLYLVKMLMDEFTVEKTKTGSICTIIKKL